MIEDMNLFLNEMWNKIQKLEIDNANLKNRVANLESKKYFYDVIGPVRRDKHTIPNKVTCESKIVNLLKDELDTNFGFNSKERSND